MWILVTSGPGEGGRFNVSVEEAKRKFANGTAVPCEPEERAVETMAKRKAGPKR